MTSDHHILKVSIAKLGMNSGKQSIVGEDANRSNRIATDDK